MPKAIKERGILMHARSVLNILAGRKTQTRRIIKGAPDINLICGPYSPTKVDGHGEQYPGDTVFGAYDEDGLWAQKCPYGQPGDRLWVRETHYQPQAGTSRVALYLDGMKTWESAGGLRTYGPDDETELFRKMGISEDAITANRGRKIPSIHMPRWASRITLEITDVRVERVQDISEADAKAEGAFECELPPSDYAEWPPGSYGYVFHDDGKNTIWPKASQAFKAMWDDTNGKGAWDRNDWVWALTFKVVS